MNELIPDTHITGKITLDGDDIYAPDFDVVALRQRVGMVFQRPTPFPKSIFENVAYGLRVAGITNKTVLTTVPWGFPAASSSASALHVRWRLNPKCF